jgi:hypothetical protein
MMMMMIIIIIGDEKNYEPHHYEMLCSPRLLHFFVKIRPAGSKLFRM